MSIGFVRGLRILHRGFHTCPAGDRLHAFIRYVTCPFRRFLDEVPPGARVLEIGAGHGVVSQLMVENGAREVVAVDPDLHKSFLPSPSPKVKKVAGYDDCIRGSFDAIVICDVLYLLDQPLKEALLARVFAHLRPGGKLILKEMDPERRWKIRWAKFQEGLNEGFLHLTHGSGFRLEPRERVFAMLAAAGFADMKTRSIDRGYPHPHFVYTAVKPST